MDETETLAWKIRIAKTFMRSHKQIPSFIYARLPRAMEPDMPSISLIIKNDEVLRNFNKQVIYRHIRKFEEAGIARTWGKTNAKYAVRTDVPPEIHDYIRTLIEEIRNWPRGRG